jgi:hypothetical protein
MDPYYRDYLERSFSPANLNNLLSRPWVHRSWTFQELILANNIEIGCGRSWVRWEEFAAGLAIARFDLTRASDKLDSIQNLDTWISLIANWLHLDRPRYGKWQHLSCTSTGNSIYRSQEMFRDLWSLLSLLPFFIYFVIKTYQGDIYYGLSTFETVAGVTQLVIISSLVSRLLLLLLVRDRSIYWPLIAESLEWCLPSRKYTFPSLPLSSLMIPVDGFCSIFLGSLFAESSAIYAFLIFLCLSLFTVGSEFSLPIILWVLGILLILLIGGPSDDLVWRFNGSESSASTRKAEGEPHRLILSSVLRALRSRQSHKPIDKAFALYGILENQGLNMIQPSTNTRVEDAYKDLFLNLLEWGSTLNLLLDAGIGRSPNTLTWVPDWTLSQTQYWLDERYIYDLPRRTINAFCRVSDDRQCLIVRACHVEEAVIATNLVLPQDALEHHLAGINGPELDSDIALAKWVQHIREKPGARTPPGYASFGDALLQVLSADLKASNETFRRRFENWFRHFTDHRAASSSDSTLSYSYEDPNAVVLRMRTNSDSRAYIFQRELCQRINQKRALCTLSTQIGTLMATGVPAMEPGDLVMAVNDVSVPLIVRATSVKDRFQLVGPLLVPGLAVNRGASSFRDMYLI